MQYRNIAIWMLWDRFRLRFTLELCVTSCYFFFPLLGWFDMESRWWSSHVSCRYYDRFRRRSVVIFDLGLGFGVDDYWYQLSCVVFHAGGWEEVRWDEMRWGEEREESSGEKFIHVEIDGVGFHLFCSRGIDSHRVFVSLFCFCFVSGLIVVFVRGKKHGGGSCSFNNCWSLSLGREASALGGLVLLEIRDCAGVFSGNLKE